MSSLATTTDKTAAMPDSFVASAALPEEWEQAFSLIFGSLSVADRAVRVENALRLIGQRELDPAGIWVIRTDGRLIGALVCQLLAGASALVWPPRALEGTNQAAIEDQLLAQATAWLKRRGAKLAQTLLSPEESLLGAPLVRNGFAHITSLWYLRHNLELLRKHTEESTQLHYMTYASGSREIFHQTLLRTYEDTQDCPEVNDIRELEEIIEGHQAQGIHDPNRWWLASDDSGPVGVVLMAELPEWQGWDLSYLGVVPEARRRGIGRELARKALREAHLAGATQLTLAVDTRNRPAWDLYVELGFNPYEQREVYLAIWKKPE